MLQTEMWKTEPGKQEDNHACGLNSRTAHLICPAKFVFSATKRDCKFFVHFFSQPVRSIFSFWKINPGCRILQSEPGGRILEKFNFIQKLTHSLGFWMFDFWSATKNDVLNCFQLTKFPREIARGTFVWLFSN